MGQYYHLFNLDKNQFFDPFKLSSGAFKLMEPCYTTANDGGNEYIDTILHLLMDEWHGDNVVFCGDYAFGVYDEQTDTYKHDVGFDCDATLKAKCKAKVAFNPWDLCNEQVARCEDVSAWHTHHEYGKNFEDPLVCVDGTKGHGVEHYRYVINRTKGIYYDRSSLPVAWVWRDTDHDSESYGTIRINRLDPLTLFLALGNGLGGGDYDAESGREEVGSWAFDEIGATNDVSELEGIVQVCCPFNESDYTIEESDEVLLPIIKEYLDERYKDDGAELREVPLSQLAALLDEHGVPVAFS